MNIKVNPLEDQYNIDTNKNEKEKLLGEYPKDMSLVPDSEKESQEEKLPFDFGEEQPENETQEQKRLKKRQEEDKLVKEFESKKNLMFEQKNISIFRLICHLGTKYEFFLMGFGIFTSLFSGLGGPLISVLFGTTMNNYSSTQDPEAIFESLEKRTNMTLKYFLFASLGMFISGFIKNFSWNYSGLLLVYHLKEKYFRIILKQEQGWFDENNPFEFATKVQAQLEQIEMGIGDSFGNVFQTVTSFIAGLLVAFFSSWKLTLVIFSFAPAIFLVFIFLFRKVKKVLILSRKTYEKAGGIAEELLYNIKTVASFANYDYENERFGALIEQVHQYQCEISFKFGLTFGLLFIFINMIFIVAILYGKKLIKDKEWNNTTGDYFQAGDVLTVIMSSISAIGSIGGIGPNLKIIKEASTASSDYFTLMERKPRIDLSYSTYKVDRNEIKGKIEFKDVDFTYPIEKNKGQNIVLKGLDLVFEPGKKIAIVGESGCGKSTIVNLIERLYEPQTGEILLDGENIKKYDIEFYRSLIGYVQQEPVLFNKSIKDNLVFGREELLKSLGNEKELIEQACEDSFATEFTSKNKEGYDYIVGIKGSKLSGGQKQRLAIARATLCQPKILLLDEATSALDIKSEKEVQRALDNIINKKNITTIIIAHRLSTIKNADIIYVIKDGKVFESGTHEELLKKEGHYANLINTELANGLNNINNSSNNNEGDVIKNKLSKQLNKEKQLNFSEEEDNFFSNSDKNNYTVISKQNKVGYRIILELLKNNMKKVFFALTISFVGGGILPITGYLFANYIASLSKVNISQILEDSSNWTFILIISSLFNGFLTFLKMWLFQSLGSIITSKLRKKVLEKYLQLHMSFYDNEINSPGSLLTKLSLDTTQLTNLVLTVYGESFGVIGTCLFGLSIGFYYSWRLTIIEMCFIPIIVVCQVMRRLTRRGGRKKERKTDIEAGAVLSEYVVNTKTVYSFSFQDDAVNEYLGILERQKKNFFRDAFLRSFLVGVTGFINFISSFIVLKYAFKFIKEGKLVFRSMIIAMVDVLMLGGGIANGLSGLVDYNKANNAFKSIFDTLNTKSEIDVSYEINAYKIKPNNLKGKIEFKGVSFAYPTKPEQLVLKNISFEINPGQSAALVGYSGSGKSTIIQLLERFYDVTEGEILYDGVNIKDYDLIELRKKIGLVLQEPVLFKRDLYENIRYGKLTSTKEEILEAAKNAKITKYFKEGQEGQKNDSVSGGEKQRIAIARAFLKNPIVLLLDEATSALDKETEIQVQKSIDILQKGRTSIVVAHRLSTIENCDIIFVLEEGRIVEKGSHKELMELKGKYFSLH